MSYRSKKGKDVKEQFEVHKEVVIREAVRRLKTIPPPVFSNMPRPEQQTLNHSPGSQKELLCCPDGFFGIDHPNTIWMVNILKDTSEWRLQKNLMSLRSRPLFDEKRFYQMIDRPTYYCGESARLDRPLFRDSAMLYLNAFGVALYLKSDTGASRLSAATSGKCSMVSSFISQYASFVHDSEFDIVKFNFDFLCIKREYHNGLRYLANTGWNPANTTTFTYRRKFYQFCIPFTDWVDVIRFMLKKRPTMNVAKLVDVMYSLQYVVSASYNFTMTTMKEIGKVMMEAFELREIHSGNSDSPTKYGQYAGRKVLKNKDVVVSDEFSSVFTDAKGNPEIPLRPVVPNVMSFVRRLLTFQFYFDNENMFALPQILRAVMCFKQHDFFVATQAVRNSKEIDRSGHHIVYLDPLIFQINYFLNLKSRGVLLRHKPWSSNAKFDSDKITEEERDWYYRFDTFNCLSLLAGLLQNCLIKNMSEGIIETLCDLIIFILVDAELIEAVFRYSYYDTYFGLTSVINCVPNLMSKTVLRLLKKAPITLVSNYELTSLTRMFSPIFWGAASDQVIVPKNMEEMSDFLVQKRRRVSMKVEGAQTGEAMSGASSMGAAGGVTMFARDYKDMQEINPADEAADQPASETTRKQDEERRHVREYRRMETDTRYSTLFLSYYAGLNRAQVQLDEKKRYDTCISDTYNSRRISFLK